MATKEQIQAVLVVQRICMQISVQGRYEFHTYYWGHTDEISAWGNTKGRSCDIPGWGSRDHTLYLGKGDLVGDLSDLIDLAGALGEFLETDSDGIPV